MHIILIQNYINLLWKQYIKDSRLIYSTMKYWVFGHTYDPIEYEIENVKFLCNPLGYPNESNYGDNIKMKSFEIQKSLKTTIHFPLNTTI